MNRLDSLIVYFMVFIIIAFVFVLWNIYCDYKKMKKLKNIEKMTRGQFLERIEKKYTNKRGLIKEIESCLDDSGNEVLYVDIYPQICILNHVEETKHKLVKGNNIYISKICIDVSIKTDLPMYIERFGWMFEKKQEFQITRECYCSSLFVNDKKQSLVEKIENVLYEDYCFYFDKINEMLNYNFFAFALELLKRRQ